MFNRESPSRVRLANLGRFFALYVALVFFSATYVYFYANQLTRIYHDPFTAYDAAKHNVYALVVFLTPISILPVGIRFRAPGQFIVAALTVFLLIPIPVVFVAMVSEHEFWSIYALLWVGYLCLSTCSSISVRLPLPNVTEHAYRQIFVALYVLVGLGLLYVAATNHLSIVGLREAHAARRSITVSGLDGYLLGGYLASFGGLLMALSIMHRKYYLLVLSLAGYVVCFASLEEREAALMPIWLIYVMLTQQIFYKDSITKFVFTAMAPFMVGVLFAGIVGTEERQSVLFYAFSLANYRLFSVPAIAFNVYYNFFEIHPLTYWSHITLVSKFISYPYGEDLGSVMQGAYHLGSYNASFLQTDALAAAGTTSLPFVCLGVGLVIIFINSCMRGLNSTICAIVMAGPSIALVNTGIGPSVLTNGLALLSVLMLLIPRDAQWNLGSSWKRVGGS